MSADSRWPREGDPPRDPVIARLLRAAGATPPLADPESERLQAVVMAAIRSEVARVSPISWWDVAARWLPAAAAAGLAAALLSGVVILSAARSGGLADDAEAPPETAAVAQVLASYPADSVLASLVASGRAGDLADWSEP